MIHTILGKILKSSYFWFTQNSGMLHQVVEWANWSTSPRAYLARWSITVPRLSNGRTGRPVPEHIMLGGRYSPQVYHVHLTKDPTYFLKKSYRHINVRCDGASCHLVSLLHKKGGLRTVHPLIAGIKKGNQQLLKNGHQIYCDSS